MTTMIAFHDVNDVEHWLRSPKREELMGPLGIKVRTFVDRAKTKRVGLILEIPDMDAFQKMMTSAGAAEAMKYDGVLPETMVMLVQS